MIKLSNILSEIGDASAVKAVGKEAYKITFN
jgi:hypothetical protein